MPSRNPNIGGRSACKIAPPGDSHERSTARNHRWHRIRRGVDRPRRSRGHASGNNPARPLAVGRRQEVASGAPTRGPRPNRLHCCRLPPDSAQLPSRNRIQLEWHPDRLRSRCLPAPARLAGLKFGLISNDFGRKVGLEKLCPDDRHFTSNPHRAVARRGLCRGLERLRQSIGRALNSSKT